jgi:hypothetical protein
VVDHAAWLECTALGLRQAHTIPPEVDGAPALYQEILTATFEAIVEDLARTQSPAAARTTAKTALLRTIAHPLPTATGIPPLLRQFERVITRYPVSGPTRATPGREGAAPGAPSPEGSLSLSTTGTRPSRR